MEFDKKDAHQEKVLLLNIAKFEDLIILKSFFIEFDLRIEIFKSIKYYFISFIISLAYCRSSEMTLKVLNPFLSAYSIAFL